MNNLKLSVYCFFLTLGTTVFGQNSSPKNSVPLSISWQPVENNYLGKEQSLSVLEIKNNSKEFFPASGWKLFFNFIRIITPKNQNDKFDIHHVNGDLFYFTPSKSFVGLKPGESIRYEMIANSWLVNVSDAPQGFYIVWDDKQIQPLAGVNIIRPRDDKKFYRVGGDAEVSPAMLYEKNKLIKEIPTEKLTKIFPTPEFYQEFDQSFTINAATKIVFAKEFEQEAKTLNTEFLGLFGKKLKIGFSPVAKNVISIAKNNLPAEAYELDITPQGIVIKAGTASGVFYGIQSLKTLFNPNVYASHKNKSIVVKSVKVKDQPRFLYRGLMLDVARNFQTKAEIKRILDLMGLYKLNTLHFHLNDDEGWRLEIPALPELTAVGAKRAHVFDGDQPTLPPSYGSGPFANQSSGSGYYSKADFIEILRYAAERHIQVIPEIETPGHARAAIKAMEARYQRLMKEGKPEEASKYLLHDDKDVSAYRSVQKWNDNVMDVAMPSVYTFLELVTDEVIGMYKEAKAPLNTIHFGGDEVPNGVWEESPSFKKLQLTDTSIKGTEDLWEYFFNKVQKMLANKGLYVSGWEEVGLHKMMVNGKKTWMPNEAFSDRNIHLNVWNNLLGNEDLAYRLANSGYKVIISFVNNFYLDMAYQKNFEEPGFYWGGFTDLAKPYSFIPFDYLKNQQKNYLGRQLSKQVLQKSAKLTAFGKSNIQGIQGQLWSETVKNAQQAEYLILPRLLPLAERAWASSPTWADEPDSLKAVKTFTNDLAQFFNQVGKRELKRLDNYAGGFDYRIPSAGLKAINGKVHANCELPGFIIRYTTDGTKPNAKSPVYENPIDTSKNPIFRVFNTKGRGGLTVSALNQ